MSSPSDRPTPSTRSARRAAVAATLARQERRRRVRLAAMSVVGVLALIAVIVAIGVLHKPRTATSTTATAALVSKVTSIPAATYDLVGAGQVAARPSAITAPLLRDGAKPRVVYVGAEYCPFCAAERWAVVAALSRFGTFAHLGATTSAAGDVYPNTVTLSFHGSTYTSAYLSFSGIEVQSNQLVGSSYAPLDTLSAADQKLQDTYDQQQYTGQPSGGIPFLDLGGRWVSSGASYSPQLFAGMTHEQVADALADPASPIARAVVGTANVLTADLCQLTGGAPAAVCGSKGVTAAR